MGTTRRCDASPLTDWLAEPPWVPWSPPARRRFTGFAIAAWKPRHRSVLLVGLLALDAASVATILRWGRGAPALVDLLVLVAVVWGRFFGPAAGACAAVVSAAGTAPLVAAPLGANVPWSWWTVGSILALALGTIAGARTCALVDAWARADRMAASMLSTCRNALELIAEAVEHRDPTTAGHSRRVATNARTLGAALGLDDAAQRTLYWAGLLHDVGKVGVPDSVLLKPSALTDAERRTIELHPVIGARLIDGASGEFAELAAAVRGHHERWDGRGYPDRLNADEIPLFARILCVVDVFDALTSPRPYHAPVHPTHALACVREGAGSQFDPAIVDVFSVLFARGSVLIPAWASEALTEPSASLSPVQ